MPGKTEFDLAVIGGSFAGLACARTAALRGLKVAVIDAKEEPGARIRTTGIVVKEASDEFDLPAHLMRKVRGVRLYAPDGRNFDMHAPGYFFQATDTAGLLRWMALEAERAGAKLMFGTRFDGAADEADCVRIPALGVRARFLAGADGARSRVARFFRLGRNRRFLAGAEVECAPEAAIDGRFLHCFADSRFAPGYIGWAVPGAGVTQIGVAARRPGRPDLAGFLESIRAIFGIGELRIMARRAGLIPTGGTVSPLGRGRVLLIGDAAGLVSPVTGGGIHTAMHSGRRAAQLVAEYLEDRGSEPVAALEREAPRFRLKRAARRVLDLAPPNRVIDALLTTGPMRAAAQRIYFHRRNASGLSFEDWLREFESGDGHEAALLRLADPA